MGTPYQRHLQGEQRCSPCWSSRKPSGGGAAALAGVTRKMEGSQQGSWSIAQASWQSCRARQRTAPREQPKLPRRASEAPTPAPHSEGDQPVSMAAAFGGMPGAKPLAKLPEEGKRESKVRVPRSGIAPSHELQLACRRASAAMTGFVCGPTSCLGLVAAPSPWPAGLQGTGSCSAEAPAERARDTAAMA